MTVNTSKLLTEEHNCDIRIISVHLQTNDIEIECFLRGSENAKHKKDE